eukprot:2773575-Rhodomonas_salina.1
MCIRDRLWTNPEGLRQIRGAPKAMFAFPAPPVEVQERLQPESGEVVTVRSDLVMTVVAKDGRRLVQHADGTQVLASMYRVSRALITLIAAKFWSGCCCAANWPRHMDAKGREADGGAVHAQIVTLPAEDDQPSDTQHIICEGMAS